MKTKKNEGAHYNTKIRSIDSQAGTKRIRMGLRESANLIGNILNPDHPSPNPATDLDADTLNECKTAITEAANKMFNVKTIKRKKMSEAGRGKIDNAQAGFKYKKGDKISGINHGEKFSGEVIDTRRLTTNHDVTEVRVKLDKPISTYGGEPQNTILLNITDKGTFWGEK